MRLFIDTEFYENGPTNPVKLISLAMVDEGGREYYAESSEINLEEVSDWIKLNVVPKLTGPKKTVDTIKQDIIDFVGKHHPEIWGYFSDYDWVVFCQIFGRMIDLPENFPKYCLDLKQMMLGKRVSRSELPKEENEHHALSDARWNLKAYAFLSGKRYL
jgi:hypothetical protein